MGDAAQHGINVEALAHTRKATGTNTHPNTIDDVYGSTWITAGAGSMILRARNLLARPSGKPRPTC